MAHEPLGDILLGVYRGPKGARQGEMATVAAAVALGHCQAVSMLPTMLRLLKRTDAIGGLNFALIRSVQDMGEPALDDVWAAFEKAESSLERQQLGLILAGLEVTDERVSTAVIQVISDNPSVGATLARRYEVPGVEPALHAELDSFEVSTDRGKLHHQVAVDLADAIEALGGALTAGQQLKVAAARRVLDAAGSPQV